MRPLRTWRFPPTRCAPLTRPVPRGERVGEGGDGGGEDVGGGALRLRQARMGVFGVGALGDRLRRQGHGLQRTLVDEAVDHAGAHRRRLRQLALDVDEAARRGGKDARPRRRHPFRRRTGEANADPSHFRASFLRQLEGEGQDGALGGKGIPGHPIDQPPHRLRHRRRVNRAGDALEVGGGARAEAPYDPNGLARAERHAHGVALLKIQTRGNGVAIGRVQRQRHQDVGDERVHAGGRAFNGIERHRWHKTGTCQLRRRCRGGEPGSGS